MSTPYYLLGADEAGRGCLAGDLVVAVVGAVVDSLADPLRSAFVDPEINALFHTSKVKDSKTFHREDYRLECADEIMYQVHCGRLFMAMRERTSRQVDESRNINRCTHQAWAECVQEIVAAICEKDPTAVSDNRVLVIIDGNSFKPSELHSMPCAYQLVKRADALFPCVSAASILAKCAHDDSIERILQEEAKERYLPYELNRNKGYATKSHLAAIRTHGPSDQHRMTFEPCKSWRKPV